MRYLSGIFSNHLLETFFFLLLFRIVRNNILAGTHEQQRRMKNIYYGNHSSNRKFIITSVTNSVIKNFRMKKYVLPSTIRRVKDHDCGLPIQGENLHYRIDTGCFVLLRRRIWTWKTVSRFSPESKRILKSTAEMYAEEVHHFEKHPNIIHPFSQARFVWEMIMIPVFLFVLFMTPVMIATEKSSHFLNFFKLFLDVTCYIDVIISFSTGFYDIKKQNIVLDFKHIAKRYILSYFVFDVVSSLPVHYYLYLRRQKQRNLIKLVWLLKIVRMPTLTKYLHKMSERIKFLENKMKLICFILWLLIVIIWATTFMFLAVRMQQTDEYSIQGLGMLVGTFSIVRLFMVVGVTFNANNNKSMMICQIVSITIGTIINIVILAKVMQFMQKLSTSKNKYNNLIKEIEEYMKYKELPLQLKNRIVKYVEFKFQKHIFREEDVLNNLSSLLKQEILVHRCQKMVEKVEFFKDLPTHVLLRIVTKLRSEIYLPSDVIVLAGYPGHAMYFIYMGSVAVYTGNGKEICHLEDGSHFGEIALVINAPRVATVVAVKECELFKLSRKDFQEAIQPFPDLTTKIRNLAMSRLENTLQMMSENLEELGMRRDTMIVANDDTVQTISI